MKNILKPSILAACVIAIAMLTLAQNTTILPPKMPQKPQQSEQQAQKPHNVPKPLPVANPSEAMALINRHGYVDLGLSVYWATCNVGGDSPEDYGDYFAWGETAPKASYTTANYKTPQNNSLNDISGNAACDAASLLWETDYWRLPSEQELEELAYKCSWKWCSYRGTKGYEVTGPNGNSIFLPAAGFKDNSLKYLGSIGCYWSGTHGDYPSTNASHLHFSNEFAGGQVSGFLKYLGCSIRPVVDKNIANALFGDTDAMYELYKHYSSLSNFDEAYRWLKKAAEADNYEACYYLAMLYYTGKIESTSPLYEAEKWMNKAYTSGYDKAKEYIAELWNEIGLECDKIGQYKEALKWFEKAAELNHADAQNNIGIYYSTGRIGKIDYNKAFYYFSKAADQSYIHAQYNLGLCYERGRGVGKDLDKAEFWYQKAAEQGYKNAYIPAKRLKKHTVIIYDANQEPMIGATCIHYRQLEELRQLSAMATGFDGECCMRGLDKDDIIEVQYVGFKTKRVKITSSNIPDTIPIVIHEGKSKKIEYSEI